jgi:hypothetical protein
VEIVQERQVAGLVVVLLQGRRQNLVERPLPHGRPDYQGQVNSVLGTGPSPQFCDHVIDPDVVGSLHRWESVVLDLLPVFCLEEIIEHFTVGALHHHDGKVLPIVVEVDSLLGKAGLGQWQVGCEDGNFLIVHVEISRHRLSLLNFVDVGVEGVQVGVGS